MKKFKFILSICVLVLSLLIPMASGANVSAANLPDECPETSYFQKNIFCEQDSSGKWVIKHNAVETLIMTILNWALVGVGTIVVIIVVIGGIRYMTAAGNQDQAKKAMTMIRNAIFALVLYIVMITVLNFIIPGGVFRGTDDSDSDDSGRINTSISKVE